jgi:hypothetical protein
MCEGCGAAIAAEVHHRDGDPSNNELENLEVLCRACHRAREAEKRTS